MQFTVGDRVIMKKPHPCGSTEFTVLRTGLNLKLECAGCGRVVEGERFKLERKIKRVESKTEDV
ncbi:MAG: DUF951 domain-containing protein [Clostridia bacterium]|nr:DUF951 domain-containing protein [Clostridia bacterium]